MAVDTALQQIDERGDMAPKPDAPASLLEVLTTDAAELRIVTNQIGQFPALLDQIAPREALNLLVKAGGADQLAEHCSRIVEAQRLIEIGCDQEVRRGADVGHGVLLIDIAL